MSTKVYGPVVPCGGGEAIFCNGQLVDTVSVREGGEKIVRFLGDPRVAMYRCHEKQLRHVTKEHRVTIQFDGKLRETAPPAEPEKKKEPKK